MYMYNSHKYFLHTIIIHQSVCLHLHHSYCYLQKSENQNIMLRFSLCWTHGPPKHRLCSEFDTALDLQKIREGKVPYSGKLSREKTFMNFEVREPSAKVFSTKFWGMPHPLMFGFKQSVKVFSVKFSLPTDPQKFSPSKVYRYTVCIGS